MTMKKKKEGRKEIIKKQKEGRKEEEEERRKKENWFPGPQSLFPLVCQSNIHYIRVAL